MIAVAVGTMSLVIVLSVFNGLEEFIRSLYNSFDPQLKVLPVSGKTFEISESFLSGLEYIEGVEYVIQVIEDNAGVKYRDAETVVKMKGVDENFLKEERLRNNIVEGELKLRDGTFNYAILGRGVQYALNISSVKDIYPLQFFYPKKGRRSGLSGSINRMNIMPAGVFAIEKQYDMNYILVPLEFAAGLTEYKNKRTSLEIKVRADAAIDDTKNLIQGFIGSDFKVLDSDEQHASFLRAIKIEKLFVYLTFSFIIAVAAFNIFFALTMLAIDKKKDISILYALGANNRTIRLVFLKEGAIIALSGSTIGLIAGILICWIQQTFGVVSMGIETSIINTYPVKMVFTDFIFTGLSIIIITLLFSLRPASMATKTNMLENI